MEKILCLDIETIPRSIEDINLLHYLTEELVDKRLKDPSKIKEDLDRKMSLSAIGGKICVVGTYRNFDLNTYTEEREYTLSQLSIFNDTEESIIANTIELINNAILNGARIVTYYGKGFDLPFLMKRAIILGVSNKIRQFDRLINKYNQSVHLDLYQFFGEGKQVVWGYLLGITDKLENEGNMIKEWYDNGEYDKILSKNAEDLKLSMEIAERVIEWT